MLGLSYPGTSSRVTVASLYGVFQTLLSPQPYDIPTVWNGEKLTPVVPHVR